MGTQFLTQALMLPVGYPALCCFISFLNLMSANGKGGTSGRSARCQPWSTKWRRQHLPGNPLSPTAACSRKTGSTRLGEGVSPASITAESWDSGQAPQTPGPHEGQCLLLQARLGFHLQDSHLITLLAISARCPGSISFLPALLAARTGEHRDPCLVQPLHPLWRWLLERCI